MTGSRRVVKLTKLAFVESDADTMVTRASAFADLMQRRRTVRDFSERSPAEEIILD